MLELPESFAAAAECAAREFPLLVPLGFVSRMRRGDVNDPLLRQVLPVREEATVSPGFTTDPVVEIGTGSAPGLLQKYPGRALLVTTGACAVHCRYCFRRHYPYDEGPRSLGEFEPAFAAIESDPSIDEVLLSGGDPLTRTDSWLSQLVQRLERIPQLRRLRIHARLPIVLPERVDDALLAWLAETRLTPIFVVHCNHPQELDGPTRAALGRLVDAGVPVLNQAVLLRGVNDDAKVLAELCRELVGLRVMPYYLHQLDRVAGAAHFEVSEDVGRRLIDELTSRLPGYAVPRYVREVAGVASKVGL